MRSLALKVDGSDGHLWTRAGATRYPYNTTLWSALCDPGHPCGTPVFAVAALCRREQVFELRILGL
jgi:hypothetical protein